MVDAAGRSHHRGAIKVREENHFLWLSSFARPVHARARAYRSLE
jgi:hypothetical protein